MFELDAFGGIRYCANLLAKKKLSSVELTDFFIGRLKTIGGEHRAFREITAQLALRQARASDERRAKGKSLGMLDGIPFGVKDLLATKGIPTRWGSGGHQEQVFDFDATVVSKLQDAGGVLIGKLSMIALAGIGNYDIAGASDVGATLSAWDKTLWAGGSSSGTGAAVGLGCVAYGIGSETSGSILCPSAFNGVTGMRPTYGRVSRYGAMPLCWTLDKVGPLGRSAEDCAMVLQTLIGEDPKDASTSNRPFKAVKRLKKLRIGVVKEPFAENKAEACAQGYEEVLTVLKKAGHEVVSVELPKGLPNAGLIVGLIVDGEGASAHENFIRSERLHKMHDLNQVAGCLASLEQTTTDYLWALRARVDLAKANAIWDKCDVLFRPVFYHKSLPADKPLSETWRNMGDSWISLANALGWPACAFPMAWEDGAPINGQIIGPAFGDELCLAVVQQIQRESDHHLKHPPV